MKTKYLFLGLIAQVFFSYTQATASSDFEEFREFFDVKSAKSIISFPCVDRITRQKKVAALIETDESKRSIQLISKPFPLNKRVDHVLDVYFDLIEGGFFVCLLGSDPDKFLDSKYSTIVGGGHKLSLSLSHEIPDPNVKLVIANNRWDNPGVSRFILRELDYYAIPVKDTVETRSAQAVVWTKEGIDVTTDVSTYNHQLRSAPYAYEQDQEMVYPFRIDLKAGGLLIGFLAADEKSFLTHKVFSGPQFIDDELVLKAGIAKTGARLVIANQNPAAQQSRFIIKSIPAW